MNIKDIVKNRQVHFWMYRHQIMYYWIEIDEGMFMFPVPLEDIGDATLKSDEKAITYMRYIRKALDDKTFVPARR